MRLPLVGGFQVENALVAAGLAIATGGDRRIASSRRWQRCKGAKGRLDLVGERNGAPIFVDYAHKPDALAKALEALRPYVKRQLVVVFGAGGDRDKGKRPLMGAIAAEERRSRHRHRRQSAQRKSGRDPRRDPGGARRRANVARSATAARRSAARLRRLQPGDVLLIAGKGHETGQIVGDRMLPFSDHEAVAAALREKVA